MQSRLFTVVVSSLVGTASGFFAFRNEEKKKYEADMKSKGYRLVAHYHPSTHPGTATGGGMGSTSYTWEKGTGDEREETSYDQRHRPFKL